MEWVWAGLGVCSFGLWVWWEIRIRKLEQRVVRLVEVLSQAGPNIARRIEGGGSWVSANPATRPWEDLGEVEEPLDLR